MMLRYSVTLLLIIACWAIAPALICEWRLRALNLRRGWGLIVGSAFGPLGVAAINIYISLQCLSHRTRTTQMAAWQPSAAGFRGERCKLSMRDDVLAFVCLWITVSLGSTLSTIDDLSPMAQTPTPATGHYRQSSGSEQGAAATTLQISRTQAATNVESLSSQPSGQMTRPEVAATGSKEQVLLGERQPVTPLPVTGGERNADAASTAPPAQPAPSAAAQSGGTAIGAFIPPAKPASAGASAGELMRLLVPSNLKAHGTISGIDSATTLTIACAECTYELVAGRLRSGSARSIIKAAGVRVVVLINGQDSLTFML